jgi:multiple sugar transport system substrate-binding protein
MAFHSDSFTDPRAAAVRSGCCFIVITLRKAMQTIELLFANWGKKQMKRKLLFVMMGLVLLLTACGKKEKSPMPISVPETPYVGDKRVTITFACHDSRLSDYEKLSNQFETINPTIRVKLISIDKVLESVGEIEGGSEGATRRVMSIADTASWYVTPLETNQDLIHDLTSFIETDSTFQADDFYPGLLEAFQWGGGTWGLPSGAVLTLFFFDKDAFDEVNEPYPTPSWSWDDFVAKAKALTKQEKDKVTRYGYVPVWDLALLTSYLADHDAPLEDWTTVPPTPLLNSPALARGVQWYLNLVQMHQVSPYPLRQEGPSQSMTFIEEKRAAMWTEPAVNYQSRSQSFNLGVAPFPSDSEGDTTPLLIYGHVMSAGTAHPDEAWRWLHFLSRQEPVGWSSASVPARRSVATASGFWVELDQEAADVYHYALNHAFLQNTVIASVALQFLERAIDAVLMGEKNVENALAEAQEAALASQIERASAVGIEVPVVASPVPNWGAGDEEIASITFIGGFGDLSIHRELAQVFHKNHPNIIVQVQPEPYEEDWIDLSKLAAASDCFYWMSGVEAEDTAYVLNLNPFLSAEPDFPQDDFYPVFWDRCRWQGDLWCLPFDVQVGVIRYNKDLFDAAEVAYPQTGWTLDDFLSKTGALTQGEGVDKQYGFSSYISEGAGLSFALGLQGGSLWDFDSSPPSPQFNDPAVIEAVQWYVDLARVYGVRPFVRLGLPFEEFSEESQIVTRLVETGKVAMWIEFVGLPQVTSPTTVSLGMVPFPQENGRSASFTTGNVLFISAQAEHPQACWEWIKFLSSHLESVRGIPARRSLAESATFRQKVGDEAATIYLYALEQSDNSASQAVRQYPWVWRARHWFNQAYDAVLDGADASLVLGEAQHKAEQYILCLETKQDLAPEARELACAQEVDPSYPLLPWEK